MTKLLDVLSGIKSQALPATWSAGLLQILSGADETQRLSLASWLSNMKLDESQGKSVAQAIERIVDQTTDDSIKLKLLAALRPGTPLAQATHEKLILQHFLGEKNPATIHDASLALSRVKLSAENAALLFEQSRQSSTLGDDARHRGC